MSSYNINQLDLTYIPKSLSPPVAADSTDERAQLFQYHVQKYFKRIEKYFNHPLQSTLIAFIKTGQWKELINFYKQYKDSSTSIHEILNAACFQKKLEVDELVSAYIALAPAGSGHSYKVLTFDEVIKSGRWNIQDHWKSVDDIPENQRFFIQLNTTDMSKKVSDLWKAFFDDHNRDHKVVGGITHLKDSNLFLISSASLMRTDSLMQGKELTFLFGMGRRAHVAFRQLQGKHDISFFTPEQEISFHGTQCEGNLSEVHDGFHAYTSIQNSSRKDNKISHEKALKLVLFIEKILLEKVLPYSDRSVIQTDKTYRRISSRATLDDKVRFILEEVCQNIIDGEDTSRYEDDMVKYVEYTINGMISRRMNQGYGSAKDILSYYPILNTYLKELGVVYRKNEAGFLSLEEINGKPYLERNPINKESISSNLWENRYFFMGAAFLICCLFSAFLKRGSLQRA